MWRRGYGRTRIGHGRRRGGSAPPDRVRGWRRDASRGERCRPKHRRRRHRRSKAAGGGKANALQRPLRPSEALAAVVGPGPLPRGEVVSKVWDYIKAHNLQNPEDRREILADDTLRKVFGKDKVTMFEMNKHLAQHLA